MRGRLDRSQRIMVVVVEHGGHIGSDCSWRGRMEATQIEHLARNAGVA